MKIYVVEHGMYSDHYTASTHSSPELAMAHYPNEEWIHVAVTKHWPESWHNTKDFSAFFSIEEFELDPSND